MSGVMTCSSQWPEAAQEQNEKGKGVDQESTVFLNDSLKTHYKGLNQMEVRNLEGFTDPNEHCFPPLYAPYSVLFSNPPKYLFEDVAFVTESDERVFMNRLWHNNPPPPASGIPHAIVPGYSPFVYFWNDGTWDGDYYPTLPPIPGSEEEKKQKEEEEYKKRHEL